MEICKNYAVVLGTSVPGDHWTGRVLHADHSAGEPDGTSCCTGRAEYPDLRRAPERGHRRLPPGYL